MSIVDKILAKLAGFDPKEFEQATLTRTQIGHEAMPSPKVTLEDERARVRHDMNREREQERARRIEELQTRPVPDADTLHQRMIEEAEQLAKVNREMENRRLQKEAEEKVKEKVAKILEEKKAA